MKYETKAKIYYRALDDFRRKAEKLDWLRDRLIEKIELERLEPDGKSGVVECLFFRLN